MKDKNDSNKCTHESDLCHYVAVNWGILKLEECYMSNNANYRTKCIKCGTFYYPGLQNYEIRGVLYD